MKKILILGGGFSKERAISLDTAKSVLKALKKKNYKAIICEPDGNLIKKIKSFRPNVVFNALHGRFGEDGYVQAILETAKVKYTHSGVMASYIAMDKEISKKLFLKNKIITPKYLKYKFNKNNIIKKKIIFTVKKKLKFPVVIKPINEGSSVNVYICNKKNLIQNLKKLFQYKEILIEEYIPGREIQVAILGKKKLGAIELKPKRKFYDYEAKYSSKAATKHIIPVELDKKDFNNVMNIALKVHKLIGCKGVTRSDFKFNKGKFYLLETNTQPGMTKLSLVPEIAAYSGMSFINLIEWIIRDASANR
jgi:D-alanine-D-alanine ligase